MNTAGNKKILKIYEASKPKQKTVEGKKSEKELTL